jgi:hypothetical protein
VLIKSKTNKSFCKGCGRQILWVRLHPSGNPRPLNPGVQFTITVREDGEELYDVDVFKHSHFRTCTNREKFRKATEPATKSEKEKTQQISLF